MEYYHLSNQISIPVIGMGTGWMNTAYKDPKYLIIRQLGEFKQRLSGNYSPENNYTVAYEINKLRHFKQSIINSQKLGYELYDTAFSYNNCEKMGDVLCPASIRSNVFIISKCSNYAQKENTVKEEFEATLKALDTDYIDLYLIHWPQTGTYIETWKIFEELYDEGKVRAIGVSNFHIHHIDQIMSRCDIKPMANELECHPLLQQKEVRDYCIDSGIQIIAHTSTGKMRRGIKDSVLRDIAVEHDKTIAQIILRWHYQLRDVSIVNSLNYDHMAENLNIFDFKLSDIEMEIISSMDEGKRIWPDPDSCDFSKL